MIVDKYSRCPAGSDADSPLLVSTYTVVLCCGCGGWRGSCSTVALCTQRGDQLEAACARACGDVPGDAPSDMEHARVFQPRRTSGPASKDTDARVKVRGKLETRACADGVCVCVYVCVCVGDSVARPLPVCRHRSLRRRHHHHYRPPPKVVGGNPPHLAPEVVECRFIFSAVAATAATAAALLLSCCYCCRHHRRRHRCRHCCCCRGGGGGGVLLLMTTTDSGRPGTVYPGRQRAAQNGTLGSKMTLELRRLGS